MLVVHGMLGHKDHFVDVVGHRVSLGPNRVDVPLIAGLNGLSQTVRRQRCVPAALDAQVLVRLASDEEKEPAVFPAGSQIVVRIVGVDDLVAFQCGNNAFLGKRRERSCAVVLDEGHDSVSFKDDADFYSTSYVRGPPRGERRLALAAPGARFHGFGCPLSRLRAARSWNADNLQKSIAGERFPFSYYGH